MDSPRFFAMTAMAFLSAFFVLIDATAAAVFPALMLIVLGFDAVAEKTGA